MTATCYNVDRVGQPGSSILTAWKAERDAARSASVQAQAATPISQIVGGSEMYDILTGGLPGNAGIPVTEATAMTVGAVYASVALIGGAIAALPFHLFKRTPGGRDRYDSDLWWLFNESPWHNWTSAAAWSYAAQSIGLRGDGFWRIHRVTPYTQAIAGFEPLHPASVQPRRLAGGEVVYLVQTLDGPLDTVEAVDMLHFTGVGFDGLRSLTPIRAALRSAGGIALAADDYAAAFFRNGARPDFALKTPNKLTEDAANLLRNTWAARHGGSSNAHLPAVLTGGLDVQQLTMSAEDAQLLSTRKFQVEDIARIFGVPPHMIGYTEKSTSWGSGIEQMSIGFVRYTLGRYLDAMRQEINRKIWPKSNIYFAEHQLDALLEGDSKTQAEYFAKSLGGPGSQGWMTINEVRHLKNLPPVPGGEKIIFAGSVAAPVGNPDAPEPDDAGEKDPADPKDPAADPQPEEPDAPDA